MAAYRAEEVTVTLTRYNRIVNEGVTAIYSFQIVDYDNTPIPAASLDTLTLTLYDKSSSTIINSRDAQDVLNANNVTVDASGNVTWTMQPEDNIIVSETLLAGRKEAHIALFEWTWDTSKKGKYEEQFDIKQLEKVT